MRVRRSRWGEKIVERIIRIVALSTITLITLIFLFIAREALGILSSSDSPHLLPVPHEAAPEIYGGEGNAGAAPEVYNPEAEFPEVPMGARSPAPQPGNGEAHPGLLQNLLSTVWQPVASQPKYGLLPLIAGTLKITVLALLIAAPLGILAAIYAAFFAPRRFRELIKPVVELLAGFPSVVIGFFCLMVVASIVQETIGTTYRLNALVGGFGLALAILPIIFTITEDSFANLPRYLWEAGLAVGARPWQVVLYIMVPAATPGIFAALLLGFGRAFGETMIVLMASGNAPLLSWSPLEPVRTMSATIGAEMGEVVWGSLHYSILFLIGVLLFVVTFLLNIVAEFWVRQRLLRRFRGIIS
ncbi:MAG: phosphate ABC transporter permease subunit PstC [Candidatus Kapabacteria bacterium]|nr:phosphate ABC transporter permease subunit PstC [Candidatus Kapabacteria bacterium]MCS7169198.1 phosphate ABC transporter permease subunit PstC [Candidatus Kapabacteria bacterium]MDW7997677.1 phosphate ABC transporter permease subunit PstC [Bacteroidota bacterium]MDW8224522.1 phosphate ABC transporter permease subunit PstC [Bacteroidota bacterium]